MLDPTQDSLSFLISAALRSRHQHADGHDEGEPDQRPAHDSDRRLDQLGLLRVRYKWVPPSPPLWVLGTRLWGSDPNCWCFFCSQGAVPADPEVQTHVAERHRPAVAGCFLVRTRPIRTSRRSLEPNCKLHSILIHGGVSLFGDFTFPGSRNQTSVWAQQQFLFGPYRPGSFCWSSYRFCTGCVVWCVQGEFGLLVLPERVWPEEHVLADPGSGQRWVLVLCLKAEGGLMRGRPIKRPHVGSACGKKNMEKQKGKIRGGKERTWNNKRQTWKM